jgi:hypothetical protein
MALCPSTKKLATERRRTIRTVALALALVAVIARDGEPHAQDPRSVTLQSGVVANQIQQELDEEARRASIWRND